MKSIGGILLLSTQLALHTDLALSVPVNKAIQLTNKETLPSSTSMAYPVIKREDISSGVQWEKRAEMKLKDISPAVKDSGSSTSQAGQAPNDAKPPISKFEFHAQGLGITTKRIGKALVHGPIRAATEIPASGFYGMGNHAYSMCRSIAQCKPKDALLHLAGIPGKIVVTGATMAAGIPLGVLNTIPPTGKAVYHVSGMIKNGIHNGLKKATGKEIDKNTDRQERLQEMRERPIPLRKAMKYDSKWLRSNDWVYREPPKTEEEKAKEEAKEKKRRERRGGGAGSVGGGGGGGGNCMGCGGAMAFNLS